MSQIDFTQMSDTELKGYFLKHRDDNSALQAYLERFNQRSRRIIANLDDPDFDLKVQLAIQQKLNRSK